MSKKTIMRGLSDRAYKIIFALVILGIVSMGVVAWMHYDKEKAKSERIYSY